MTGRRGFQPERSWRPAPEPPDPLPELASEGLREARVALWADLWQRLERYERAHERLVTLVLRLDDLLGQIPRLPHRGRLRARLAAVLADLEALDPRA